MGLRLMAQFAAIFLSSFPYEPHTLTKSRSGSRSNQQQGKKNPQYIGVLCFFEGRREQTQKTQDELQWIVAQRLLSALTIPGFS